MLIVQNLARNFGPEFRDGEDFSHLFGVFFPAVTGLRLRLRRYFFILKCKN